MKLYLNKKLESIFILDALDTMIQEMFKDPKYSHIIENIDSIDLVRSTIDPVQEFIDYWIQERINNQQIQDDMSPERQQYIKNALYAVKGAPEVFNAIERCFDLQLDWEYNFPIISVLDIKVIYVSNVMVFLNKLRNLLYHLLYYTELNLYIRNLIYPLRGDIINNISIMKRGFVVVKTEWDGEDSEDVF